MWLDSLRENRSVSESDAFQSGSDNSSDCSDFLCDVSSLLARPTRVVIVGRPFGPPEALSFTGPSHRLDDDVNCGFPFYYGLVIEYAEQSIPNRH